MGTGREGAGTGRTCLRPGCGRRVRSGQAVCAGCRKTAFGRDLTRAVQALTDQAAKAAGMAETAGMEPEARKRRARLVHWMNGNLDGDLLRRRALELMAEARAERAATMEAARAGLLLELAAADEDLDEEVAEVVRMAREITLSRGL